MMYYLYFPQNWMICTWDSQSSECPLLCLHVFFKIQFRSGSFGEAFFDVSKQSSSFPLLPFLCLCAYIIKPLLQCDYLLAFPLPEKQLWEKIARDTFLLWFFPHFLRFLVLHWPLIFFTSLGRSSSHSEFSSTESTRHSLCQVYIPICRVFRP